MAAYRRLVARVAYIAGGIRFLPPLTGLFTPFDSLP